MINQRRIRFTLFFIALVAFTASSGCTKSGSGGLGGTSESQDSVANYVNSAISPVQSALDDSEGATYFSKTEKPYSFLIEAAYAGTCDTGRFSPSLLIGKCTGTEFNRTVVSTFANCTSGQNGEFIMSGSVKLTFDSEDTCNAWLKNPSSLKSGSVDRTMSDLKKVCGCGKTWTQSSDPKVTYANVTVGGGVRTTFQKDSRLIDIFGLHRKRTTIAGATLADQSVLTSEQLQITGTREAGTRTVKSGSVVVYHNNLGITAATKFKDVFLKNDCCYPSSGTMTFELSGALTRKVELKFKDTCGKASVTTDDNVKTQTDVVLAECSTDS